MADLHNTDSFAPGDADYEAFTKARGVGPVANQSLKNPDFSPGAVLNAAMAGATPGVIPQGAIASPHEVINSAGGEPDMNRMRPPGNRSKVLTTKEIRDMNNNSEEQNTAPDAVEAAGIAVPTDKKDQIIHVDPNELGFVLETALAERAQIQAELTAAKGRIAYLQAVIRDREAFITQLQSTKPETVNDTAEARTTTD